MEDNATDSVELVSFSRGGEDFESQSTSSDVNSESELRPGKSTVTCKIKTKLKRLISRESEAEADSSGENVMKKEINLFTGVAYLVGGIIGSGIFITPNTVLALTHSFGLSMIIWVLGGVLSILGALCYIELALIVRKSGAEYSYIKEAYSFKKKHLEMLGSLLAFMYFWTSTFVIRSSSLAVICLASARYMVRPFYINCEELPEKAVVLLALMLIVILGLVNCFGLKFAARMMSLFTISKLSTVVFIVIVGLVSVVIRRNNLPTTFWHPFENLKGNPPTVFSVGLSFYSVLFAYDGWNGMSYGVEETRNVKRTLPLASYIGISIVTVSYLLINLSFFSILTYDQIKNAIAVALPFGKETLGITGLVIIPLLVSASAFGAANGSLYYGSRVLFVAAREGHAPKFLSGLHATAKTPVPSIMLLVFLSMVMMVVGTIDQLIQGVEFVTIIFILLCFIAVLILRVTHPKEPRIFKVWFIVPVAIVMTCFMLFLLIIPLFKSLIPSMISVSVTLSAVPVYFVFVMDKPFKVRPKFLDKISEFISKHVSYILNTEPTR